MTPWRSPIRATTGSWCGRSTDGLRSVAQCGVTGVVQGSDSAHTSTRWRANWTSPGTWAMTCTACSSKQGDGVEEFPCQAARRRPPLSVIEDITVAEVEPQVESGFRIVESAGSQSGEVTSIPPDTAVCEDCLRELRDPDDRRFGYPFIACTNCGPRYTMVTGLPYDRANTSMADFPAVRGVRSRVHRSRQSPVPRAAHRLLGCGPQLSMPVAAVVAALNQGQIVAIKGIGGYHLACDGLDSEAVDRLRRRKQRGDKPFAVMVADVSAAERIAVIDSASQELLASPARPVLLLPSRDAGLRGHVAPGNSFIG